MRGEHIEGHGWKIPAFVEALVQKSHYILIIITLAIGAYVAHSGLKDVTSQPTSADRLNSQKVNANSSMPNLNN